MFKINSLINTSFFFVCLNQGMREILVRVDFWKEKKKTVQRETRLLHGHWGDLHILLPFPQ